MSHDHICWWLLCIGSWYIKSIEHCKQYGISTAAVDWQRRTVMCPCSGRCVWSVCGTQACVEWESLACVVSFRQYWVCSLRCVFVRDCESICIVLHLIYHKLYMICIPIQKTPQNSKKAFLVSWPPSPYCNLPSHIPHNSPLLGSKGDIHDW